MIYLFSFFPSGNHFLNVGSLLPIAATFSVIVFTSLFFIPFCVTSSSTYVFSMILLRVISMKLLVCLVFISTVVYVSFPSMFFLISETLLHHLFCCLKISSLNYLFLQLFVLRGVYNFCKTLQN